MNANATLLQMKYARIVSLFARQAEISRGEALSFFYHSDLYQLVKNGISDMHCMSDAYLAEDLQKEYLEKQLQNAEKKQENNTIEEQCPSL